MTKFVFSRIIYDYITPFYNLINELFENKIEFDKITAQFLLDVFDLLIDYDQIMKEYFSNKIQEDTKQKVMETILETEKKLFSKFLNICKNIISFNQDIISQYTPYDLHFVKYTKQLNKFDDKFDDISDIIFIKEKTLLNLVKDKDLNTDYISLFTDQEDTKKKEDEFYIKYNDKYDLLYNPIYGLLKYNKLYFKLKDRIKSINDEIMKGIRI